MAELHMRYPWVQLKSRINDMGNAMLIAKNDRSIILLAELNAINGIYCPFRPLRTQSRKNLYHHGSTTLRNQGTTPTEQGGTRSIPDDHVEYEK